MRPHDHLTYDPDTGDMRWKPRDLSDFKTRQAWKRWNTLFPGVPAGFEQDGCLKICFRGKSYQAGRVAHEMHTGTPVPKDSIMQYADSNPFNLKFDNLRLVLRAAAARVIFEKYIAPLNEERKRKQREKAPWLNYGLND
jgi:hypothetical protein